MPLSSDADNCTLRVKISAMSLADIKKILDPRNALQSGCRVLKHPNCCALCAANNDCNKIPLHWNCRCRPEPTVGESVAAASA